MYLVFAVERHACRAAARQPDAAATRRRSALSGMGVRAMRRRRNAVRVDAAACARWRAAAQAGRRSERPPRRSASTRRRRDTPPKRIVGNGSPRKTAAAGCRTNQPALTKLMASTCGVCLMNRTHARTWHFFDNHSFFLSRPVSMRCYTAGSTRASRSGSADVSNLKNFNFNCV